MSIAEPPVAESPASEDAGAGVRVPVGTTAGEVAARLGVDASRIVLHPPAGTATRDDWITAVERKQPLCEWVDQTLVEKAMGYQEGRLASVLVALFCQAEVRLAELRGTEDEIYHITGGDGPIESGANGRVPDVAVVDAAVPFEQLGPVGPPPILAVEVLSPSNTAAEMARKRDEYFAAGVREVWLLNPPLRQVEVWSAADRMTLVPEDGSVDAAHCFPGLRVPVAYWLDRTLNRKAGPLLDAMTAN